MANLSTYYHKDYSGGLNNTANDQQIKRDEASLLRNWDIHIKGRLVKRSGLTAQGTIRHFISCSEAVTVSESVTTQII